MNNFKYFSAVFFRRCVLLVAITAIFPSFGKQIAATDSDPMRWWRENIFLLNSEIKQSTIPFSHEIQKELLKLNEAEMDEIEQQWVKVHGTNAHKKSEVERRIIREKKNIFFQKKVSELNEKIMSALEKSSANQTSNYKTIAENVLTRIRNNRNANPDSAYNYEQGGEIGFCFARAMLVHMFLLEAGVSKNHIAKIFNIGALEVEGQIWNFHVAVLVSDATDGYIVVDPLLNKIVSYKEWIRTNQTYDIKRPFSRTRFYVTDPRKFLPSYGVYSIDQLSTPIYQKYFADLAMSLNPFFVGQALTAPTRNY